MNREKVIKGLEELSGFLFKEYGKAQAEEASLYYDRFLTVDNAITLLKEQDAELSYRKAKAITHNATKLDDLTCPSCGNVIGRVRYDYCHYCGQKLDWKGCELE